MGTKSNIKVSLVTLILLLAITSTSSGRTIFVDDDGPADFNNIQAAINDSNDDDIIIVADGIYTGDGNRDIDFGGRAITLKSESGPTNCIIDCNGTWADAHRGFYFHNGEGANSVLQGFTIKNGKGWEDGGGIYCESSSPTISNNFITHNYADRGAGICCRGSSPAIIHNTIHGNYAFDGTYYVSGGGILSTNDSAPTISNNAITWNYAGYGGGIYCRYC